MEATQTALIVAVPEAEDAVGRFRASLDRAASWGVPAHITVVYPFLPPEEITADVLAAVAETVRSVPCFEVTFARVQWFGDTVAWLAPEPDQPFRALTAALWQRFPQAPPYGGTFDDLVPHLTIGHDVPVEVLARAADAVSARLPVTAVVRAVRLIAGTPDAAWRTLCEFPLAP